MRAQCCICADLFENSGNLNIAAVPCGHTFHEECLMRWLSTSSTCPSCRKQVKKNQIIKRLFFDIPELNEETADDTDSLHNQISSLKAQISSLGALKRDLTDVQDKLAASVASKEEVKEQLKKAEKDRVILERQLTHVGQENSSFQRDLVHFDATKKKLRKLENVQLMLEGTENDVNEMVRYHTEGGDTAVKQLSSMVVVVKREYNRALEDKKSLRNENRELNLQVILAQTKMSEMRKELKKNHLQLKEANKSVFDLERENNRNRRKVAHLRSALKRNKTEGSQSFMAAVHEDSPNVAYTPPPPPQPQTSCPKSPQPASRSNSDNDKNEDDNITKSNSECFSPDLFEDGDNVDKGDNKRRKVGNSVCDRLDQIYGNLSEIDSEQEKLRFYETAPSVLKMIRVTSAAQKFQAAKLRKVEAEKISAPSLPYSNFSIMQKKMTGLSSSRPLSILNGEIGLPKSRTYNGLGGSSKIEEPFETPIRRASLHSQFLKKKALKKRSPLASKPIPNQPKLKSCLPKVSSSTPSLSSSDKSDGSANIGNCGRDDSLDNISPIARTVSPTRSNSNINRKGENKKQFLVNNMFAKSGKSKTVAVQKSKKTTTASSTDAVRLHRPVNDVIDLT